MRPERPPVRPRPHGEYGPVSDVLKTLVVLGARGDMTGRLLLPALVRLAGSGELPPSTAILAVDRDAGDDDAYRDHARKKLDAHLPDRDEKATSTLLEHLSYRQADVTSADALRAAIEGAATPMAVYLALPNVLFRPTLEALAAADLPPHTTLVVEKPFGTDLEDAKALNELIEKSFDERDVFRIDHFLAKQTVLDVLGLRFANRIFEPVWNGGHISRVDITWYESLGLEGRANYYDRAGALRDMIQNHLLQMLALVAMDPPRSMTERDLRDRKVEALRAVTAPKPEDMAKATRRARYTAGTVGGKDLPAYVDAEGVDPSRGTETYAEVTFRVSNWRWGGTPFRLRTGKAIGQERREIAVYFKTVPHEPFDDRDRPNVLRFTLSPDAIALELNLNGEGDPFDLERVTLDSDFPTQELPPYSLLLKEILEGDATLSIRGDEAEELWRIVEPVLQAWERDEVPLLEYAAGSGGPKAAKEPPQPGAGPREPKQGKAAGDDPRSG
jgi:glucose-6-phosphate 1-dehydrogenase